MSKQSRKDLESLMLIRAAVSNDWKALIALMLEHGFDPNATYKGAPTLVSVAGNAPVPALKQLIDAGANVNALSDSGPSAIANAAFRGKLGAVQLLIEWGADVNLGRTSEGWTPLCAVMAGACVDKRNYPKVGHLLLERGAVLHSVEDSQYAVDCLLNFARSSTTRVPWSDFLCTLRTKFPDIVDSIEVAYKMTGKM